MEQQKVQSTVPEKNGFQEILLVLKKNILLIVIVTIVVTLIGGIFATYRKPNYIAEEQVLYRMGDGTDVAADINTMNAYKPTIMDFCDNGVVVDRANFYFYNYAKNGYELDAFINEVEALERELKSYRDEIKVLEALIQRIDDLYRLNEEYPRNESLVLQTEIEKAALCQQALIIEDIREFYTEIQSSTDQDKIDQNKQKIKLYEEYLIKSKRSAEHISGIDSNLAWGANSNTLEQKEYVEERKANLENKIETLKSTSPIYYQADGQDRITDYIKASSIGVNAYTSAESEQTFDFGVTYLDNTEKTAQEKVKILVLAFDIESSYFFTDLNTSIDDMGPLPCKVDIEKGTIILIAFAVGLVLSLLTVYLIQMFDKTVKSKEQIELLTGYPVLACIDRQEEENA